MELRVLREGLHREVVVFQVQGQGGEELPRLPQGEGQLGPVFLLQITIGAHVVDVGMAAQDAHRGEARGLQGLL